MGFSNKVIRFIHYMAVRAKGRLSIPTTLGGLAFVCGLLALMVYASGWVEKALHLPRILNPPLNIIIFVLSFGSGLFLTLWTVTLFLKAKGTLVPINPPQKLVTEGPYMHVRNPMVSGYFLMLMGLGALFRSLSLLIIFTPIFIAVVTLVIKKWEEPGLEKRLGKAYLDYKAKVPIYVPRLGK